MPFWSLLIKRACKGDIRKDFLGIPIEFVASGRQAEGIKKITKNEQNAKLNVFFAKEMYLIVNAVYRM